MYSEVIERGQRFKLALRMGIPIFLFIGILLYSLLAQYLKEIPYTFVILVIGSLAVAVYFQFYLIYKAFDERITDAQTHTFTSEYFNKIFTKQVAKKPQTLFLYSIKNIADINDKWGIKKANILLYMTAKRIDDFLQERNILKTPISRIRGGDFLLMIEGERVENRHLFDLMCSKMSTAVINDIEVIASSAIIDSTISTDFEKLIDRLYELQTEHQKNRLLMDEESENLSDLETKVHMALEHKRFSIMGQSVSGEAGKFIDVSVKLIAHDGKLIHQKRFLPIINREGLRQQYDYEKIVALFTSISTSDEHIYCMSVAAETLRNRVFLEKLRQFLQTRKLQHLGIIFKENDYYSNIKRFNNMLQEYKNMGITMILDDIGNNMTSQLYMKDLDIDIVRFEGTYGKRLDDTGYKSMVEGFNIAAHGMGIKSWIRLLEEERAYLEAKNIGINLFSGNYLGKITALKSINTEKTV